MAGEVAPPRTPRLGMGTHTLRGESCARAVAAALRCGVRLLDTASIYKNEGEVADGIAAAMAADPTLTRECISLVTKASAYELKTYESTVAALHASLERLRTPYVDVYLLHWPGVARQKHSSEAHAAARREAWRALEDCKAEGLCRAIGVSNYEVRHLDEMVVYAREMPATNQIECHPAFRQDALRARCAQLGCVVQAYSPLGTGELLEDRHVRAAARLCNCTTAQVLLAWGLARGCVVLPRSADEGRIEENAKAETVVLTEEAEGELARVAPRKFCWDPSGVA